MSSKPATQYEALQIGKFKTCDAITSIINKKITSYKDSIDAITNQEHYDIYDQWTVGQVSALSGKISVLEELRDDIHNILFPNHKNQGESK